MARGIAAQVMGSKVSDADTLRGRFHDVPNRLGRDSIAPDLPQPIDSPEDRAIIDGSRRRRPHPMSSARIARSRLPRRLSDGDSPSKVLD